MSPRLQVEALCLSFGKLVVADSIKFDLSAGERVALIGPNGAGKTTLVEMISGVLQPRSGHIRLDGQDITRFSAASRARAGIVRTFQISRLFVDLSVADNLRIAILHRRRESLRMWQGQHARAAIEAEIAALLAMLGLAALAAQPVRTVSLGAQRLVEIGLALALRPIVLLLDEPAAGVPEGETDIILDAIASLPNDLSVLLIEHDMDIVFRFAQRIIVLAAGAILADGQPLDIASNPDVEAIYFGRNGNRHE